MDVQEDIFTDYQFKSIIKVILEIVDNTDDIEK